MKDITIRAVKTFFQGFLGALAVTLPTSNYMDETVVKSLLVGAVAGGLSAMMNTIVQVLKGENEDGTK